MISSVKKSLCKKTMKSIVKRESAIVEEIVSVSEQSQIPDVKIEVDQSPEDDWVTKHFTLDNYE